MGTLYMHKYKGAEGCGAGDKEEGWYLLYLYGIHKLIETSGTLL